MTTGTNTGRGKLSVSDRARRASTWAVGLRERHASVDVGFRLVDRDRRVAAMVLAGGLAYRFFFWILALSLVLSGVLGFFDPSSVEATARDAGLGVWLASGLARLAGSAADNEWWLLLIGVWLILWTGYTTAKALVLTHAAVWGISPPKLKRRLSASLLFTGAALGLICAMAGARWVRDQSSAYGIATTLLIVIVPFAAWLLGSRLLPNRSSGWLDLVPGAVLVALGLQAMHIFTAYFLGPKLTSATELYGLIGIVTTILFWFYITGRLIIGAATLNASFTEQRHRGRAE